MLEKHKLLNTFSQNLAIMGTTFYFRMAYKCERSIVFWFFKADYIYYGKKSMTIHGIMSGIENTIIFHTTEGWNSNTQNSI